MQTIITLLIDHHPVGIERVLQVARYRGFNVIGMQLSRVSDSEQRLQLEICSNRNIELLVKQLAKIYHVRQLNIGTDFQLPMHTATTKNTAVFEELL